MNQTSQYIFNIYHYLLNLRDTMEYTIDRDHDAKLYEQRKNVLTKGMAEGSALGNFFKNNKEQGDKIIEKLNEFIKDVYGDDSTILKVADGKVRVDHTQNIKIFDYVVGISESIRDILYGYVNYAKQQNQYEDEIGKLLEQDDRLYRTVVIMLVLKEFEKSFAEFQKVMGESQGKPTPQSNFIVQNEIVKLAGFIRFARDHRHIMDTESLELFDRVNALIEMTEGRRERKDNKGFKELFDETNKELNALVAKVEPGWKETFNKVMQEAIAASQEKIAA